jgi:phage tail sheath protein FI
MTIKEDPRVFGKAVVKREEGMIPPPVSETNNVQLWAILREFTTKLLTSVWKEECIKGQKPEEAFFVKCDQGTMTNDDIANGRLVCIIGIAPVKPAEFVVFEITQKLSS